MPYEILSLRTERLSVNGRPIHDIVTDLLAIHPLVRVRIGDDVDATFDRSDLADLDERLLDMFDDLLIPGGEIEIPVLIEPAK